MNILYITYDGILEPLGDSQVLSYQEKLSKDFNIILLSYEKEGDLKNKKLLNLMIKRVQGASISWVYRRYHKSPSILATFYDLFVGLIHTSYLIYKYNIKIVHARSYPPALIAMFLKLFFGVQFVFDMRGFWADERVDGDIWEKDSYIYSFTKYLEKLFLKKADHIISLTNSAVEEIKNFKYVDELQLPITVISTCVNLEKFKPNHDIKKSDNFKFGYLGTVGTWYLFDETIKAFQIGLELLPSAKILIINKGEHDFIKSKLRKYGIPLSSVELVTASHSIVPSLIQEISATVFFLKPLFSKQASAPTKLGEFLACGIPCLTNSGIGDMGNIINSGNVGVTINDFSEDSIRSALTSLIELTNEKNIEDRCVSVAKKHFSLDDGVKLYAQIYNNLLNA
jgi:glycosyltransferase involved in cell wall biosynthesis